MSTQLDPKGKVGGQTLEVSDKPATPAGLYRHPESGQEMITLWDPLYGDAQSEAAVRVGFVRVGDAPEGAVKTVVESILESREKDSSVAGIATRLAKLEGLAEDKKAVEAENAQLKQELERLRTSDSANVTLAQEAVKTEAAQRVLRQTGESNAAEEVAAVAAAAPTTAPVPSEEEVKKAEEDAKKLADEEAKAKKEAEEKAAAEKAEAEKKAAEDKLKAEEDAKKSAEAKKGAI